MITKAMMEELALAAQEQVNDWLEDFQRAFEYRPSVRAAEQQAQAAQLMMEMMQEEQDDAAEQQL